jgi:hypothetical protein
MHLKSVNKICINQKELVVPSKFFCSIYPKLKKKSCIIKFNVSFLYDSEYNILQIVFYLI